MILDRMLEIISVYVLNQGQVVILESRAGIARHTSRPSYLESDVTRPRVL